MKMQQSLPTVEPETGHSGSTGRVVRLKRSYRSGMNWRQIAARSGGLITNRNRADQGEHRGLVSRGVHMGGTTALLVALLLAVPGVADERYAAPEFYASGLTVESSWNEILKTRGVQVEWPHLPFGNACVPISGVCLDGHAGQSRFP